MFSPGDFTFHFLNGLVETWRYGAVVVPRFHLIQPATQDLAGDCLLLFGVVGHGITMMSLLSRAVPFAMARNT